MRIIVSLLAIAIVAACATNSTRTSNSDKRPTPPRFSVNNMDLSADPKQDFAKFAFGKWLQTNSIPSDKSRWGGFDELSQYNWAALKEILQNAETYTRTSNSRADTTRPIFQVGELFASAMDTNTINKLGLAPARPDLDRIAAIQTKDDFARTIAYLHDHGVGVLFGVFVRSDAKKSDTHALYATQGGLSLPSKDYYFEPRFENIRTSFVAHVTKMLKLAGDSDEAAAAQAGAIFDLEKALAEHSKAPVELRDALANYNKMPAAELKSKVPAFPFDLYFAERKVTHPSAADIIVGQPKFYEGLQQQLASRPLSDWKAYLRYHYLTDAASFLSEPFEKERFHFYATIISGTPEMEPRWQRSARVVDRALGESLGQLYVERYYPPEARARMSQMITNLQIVMRERLQKLDWMTEPTRQKALAKFDRFVPRIGHPEKWRDYSSIQIKQGDYFGNVRRAEAFEVRRRMSKLGEPVDRMEWRMTPPTVNAYFSAVDNQIVFPAGILQPPFFDFTLDDAVNYGAIGAVIGHEITHGFDDQGRRFDAEGNLNDWWTQGDADKFQARAQKLVEQYSAYEALPGLKLNGQLSLGENIADLGGTSIAFEAYQRTLKGKPQKKIDGFTPQRRFFLSWAQQWRTAYRDDALRRQVAVGPHSPGQFRAIGPLVNMQDFHDAFGIKEGDAMYRKPEDRVKIW